MSVLNSYRFGTNLKEGLVSCWEFNETGATVAYDAVSTNHGTITGAAVQQPSVAKGYDFVASGSDNISFGNIGNVRTISFWINLDTTTESILEELASTGVSVSSGTLSYASWDNAFVDGVDTDTITTGWHHVVLTSTTNVSMTAFSFGKISTTYLDAIGDQIGVWTGELTQTEITQLYNAGNGLKYDYFDAGLKTNLVSLWELDEASGDAIDSHGSNDGTVTGATYEAQGIVSNLEKCFDFDGTDDLVSLSSTGISNILSISVWIKPHSVSTTLAILGERGAVRDSWAFYVRPTGQLGFTLSVTADFNSSSAGLVANQWQHVCVVVNGTSLTIYKNGTSIHSETMGGSIVSSSETLGIGSSRGSASNEAYDGSIDQPCIWNREITTNEITSLYNDGKGLNFTKFPAGLKTDLVSLWKFDEVSSTAIAYDAHGNNDGDIVGATVNQTSITNLDKCYDFDGTNDEVTFGDIGTGKSLSFWVNLTTTTESILEELSGTGVSVSSGTLSYTSWDNVFVDTVDTDTITTGWHHVVLTSTTDVTLSAFAVGSISAAFLDGLIDQPAIWNRVLTINEITALYNSGNGFPYREW